MGVAGGATPTTNGAAPSRPKGLPLTADGLPLSPRARSGIGLALFGALVYLPILLMQPGKVDADTKSYLYLDPSRFLARAASVWDPKIGLGTLSHQTVGYLFPMGPFYWFTEDVLGLPAWVAQRLWLGTLILLAGLGVRYLLRTLDVTGPGVPIAMLAYAFSPYVLGYSAIYSVMLSPWSALPWWIAFVALGMRRGGWKYPALFALTVQLAGALNGSALLFSLIGPALYIPFSVLVLREASWRRAWTVIWRIGLLSFLTSLWWFIPLAIEGKYGLDILRFTESIDIVSKTSLPFEVLRGLGNWYFYGKDRVGLWADARVDFTQRSLFIFISMLIPMLTLLAAGLLRWRVRAYFVLLALVGVGIAVGAEPYSNPSVLGSLYKSWALTSNLGFALRNTGRAAPLVVLSFAVLLGAGVTALDAVPAGAEAGGLGRGRGRARRRAVPGQRGARALRQVLQPVARAERADPRLLEARDREARRGLARHARAGSARHRLRVVPLGRHARPGGAGTDGPTLRGARARAVGLGAVGEPAAGPRPPGAGGRGRARPRSRRSRGCSASATWCCGWISRPTVGRCSRPAGSGRPSARTARRASVLPSASGLASPVVWPSPRSVTSRSRPRPPRRSLPLRSCTSRTRCRSCARSRPRRRW